MCLCDDIEIWKDIPGYEDRYKISNKGVLMAKSYIKDIGLGRHHVTKDKVIKAAINKHGYMFKKLCKNKKGNIYKIHQLVAMAFLNFTPCSHERYVDHIDRIKTNNNLSNLRIISPYESLSNRTIITTSVYQGVSLDKSRNKWVARASINDKYKFLGRFNLEQEACDKVKQIQEKQINGTFIKD